MRFTVLTATYNRAPTLGATYQSLCAQTFRDFEWVVVDDGSTDGTRELVASWKPFFPIRYTWKANRGKHTAVNLGVEQATGEFIAILDSDDRLVPHALERLDYHWRKIPNPERFSTLVGLCRADDGTIFGGELSHDYVDALRLKDALAQVRSGDRWGMVRADVFKQFRYPEISKEHFVLEGLVWNRILKKYAARFINEPLMIAGYAPNGLGRQGDLRFSSPKGAVLYHTELASSDVPLATRLKSAINAVRFSFVAVARGMRLLK